MVLAHREWRWNTYGHSNPWAAHFTSGDARESFFSEHFATTPSETTQTHTSSSVTTSTAVVVPVAAAETTNSPTQAQTSTAPAAEQTTTEPVTTSPTILPLSLSVKSTSSSASERRSTLSSGKSTGSISTSMSSGGLPSASLPALGSKGQPTASDSSPPSQSVAVGSSGNPSPSSGGHGIGKGEIAGIVLGIVFALGLGGLAYMLWKRRTARRRDSTFIQYRTPPCFPSSDLVGKLILRVPTAFSSDAATGRMSEVPRSPGALVPPNTPAEWDTWTNRAESPSATLVFGSPTGASGYGGGLAAYPLDEKSPSPSPSPFHDTFDPATTPSPGSTTAFALSFPMPPSPSPLSRPPASASPEPNNPIALPPSAHTQLPSREGEPSALPYTWDHPPPSSEYLPPRTPDRRSTFRASRGASGPGASPRRASFGTVAATPIYSSGVPSVDRRPPSYSIY